MEHGSLMRENPHNSPHNTANELILDRPVLITGTPRSGKTLIASVLADTGEFVWANEPIAIWNTGMPRRTDDTRGEADATEHVRCDIRAALAGIVQHSGRARYLDDLAYHALRIGFVHRVLPEAKIIHVVRDAEDAIPEMLYGWTYRDSVAKAVARRWRHLRMRSLPLLTARFLRNYITSRIHGRRATWGPVTPGIASHDPDRTLIQTVATQWAELVSIARRDLAAIPPESWLKVRQRDLLEHTDREFTRIAKFCQVRDPDRVRESASRLIDSDKTFLSVVQPTEDQWAQARDIIRSSGLAPERHHADTATDLEGAHHAR